MSTFPVKEKVEGWQSIFGRIEGKGDRLEQVGRLQVKVGSFEERRRKAGTCGRCGAPHSRAAEGGWLLEEKNGSKSKAPYAKTAYGAPAGEKHPHPCMKQTRKDGPPKGVFRNQGPALRAFRK
jgi:hypothetical protein